MDAEVTFNDCVTGYDYFFTYEPETDTSSSGLHGWVCRLEAWTTPWDRLFNRKASPATIARSTSDGSNSYDGYVITIINSNSAKESSDLSVGKVFLDSVDDEGNFILKAVTSSEDASVQNLKIEYVINARPFSLYYTPNDGSEDVFVFGLNRTSERGYSNGLTLPRLALNYYVTGAAGALALLIAATVIFRKRGTARKWLTRAAFLPASYIAAHLIVKGFGGASYALMRDFTLILLIAVLFFCAMLVAHNFFLLKKEAKSV